MRSTIKTLSRLAILGVVLAAAPGHAEPQPTVGFGQVGELGGSVGGADDISLNVGSKLILDANATANDYWYSSADGTSLLYSNGTFTLESQSTLLRSYVNHQMDNNVRVVADKQLGFAGASVAAMATWFEWDTATTPDQLSLNNTDCDGIGGDCVIFYTETGSPNLFLKNGEFIQNETDGKLTLGGSGGTNNEDLVLDLETANTIGLSSTTGATTFAFTGVVTTTSHAFIGGDIRAAATRAIYWNGRTELYSDADGQLQIENAANTSGATLDVDDAADTVVIKDQAGTGNGNLTVTGLSTLTGGAVLPVQTAATPSAPATCDASAKGRIEVVDDSDDGAGTQVCYCGMTDDSTYDWLNIADNTACTFY